MIKFSKWHGLGNDFVIIEPGVELKIAPSTLAKYICDRRHGVGADGLVLVKPLGGNAFEMRIYNSDGSEPEMCGNATRCVALYIAARGLCEGTVFDLHTLAGLVKLEILPNGTVNVDMGQPRLIAEDIPVVCQDGETPLAIKVTASGEEFTGTAVSMGNPHMVIFVPNIDDVKLEEWGPQIETNPKFPRKVNVEFVQVLSDDKVRLRVWERGCGVTAACGTGSCATVVAGVLTNRTSRKVAVILDGGQLDIEYSADNNHIYMAGPACEVFKGELNEF